MQAEEAKAVKTQKNIRVSASWLDLLFGALCSLKLAVVVILSLAAALAAGTILESLYDTATAQYSFTARFGSTQF